MRLALDDQVVQVGKQAGLAAAVGGLVEGLVECDELLAVKNGLQISVLLRLSRVSRMSLHSMLPHFCSQPNTPWSVCYAE